MGAEEQIQLEIDAEMATRIATLAQASGWSNDEAVRRILQAGMELLNHDELDLPPGVPPGLAEPIRTNLDAIAHLSAQQKVNEQRVQAHRTMMEQLEEEVEPLSREARLVQRALIHCREDLEEQLRAGD